MSQPLDQGDAGASARREYERRVARRRASAHERHPRIGNLLLRLNKSPAEVERWAKGASAEQQVAGSLARRSGPGVVVLHDRSVPKSRTNIDHIAVAPSGVWVIDTKRYTGRVEIVKPFLAPAELRVAGRDRTKLVEGLTRQVKVVEPAVHVVQPEAEVKGIFCFVDGELPLLTTLSINGFQLVRQRALARRLNSRGRLTPELIHELAAALAVAFPPA